MWEAWGSEPLNAGDTYRIRATVRGPYNSLYIGLMRAAFKWECFARGWDYVGVDSAPPMLAAHNGTFTPWTVVLSFKPKVGPATSEAGLDARGLAVLAGVIVAAALALQLVEPKLEHLVTATGGAIGTALQPVGSPLAIVLVAALAVGALYFLKR